LVGGACGRVGPPRTAAGAGAACPPQPTAKSATSRVSVLTNDVKRLADPAWEGRGPGTKGLELAGEYLAERMRTIGLAPGGDEGTGVQTREVTTGQAYSLLAAMRPLR